MWFELPLLGPTNQGLSAEIPSAQSESLLFTQQTRRLRVL